MTCASIVVLRSKLDALTYEVPEPLVESIAVGSAVKVELRRRPATGIVTSLESTSGVANLKPVLQIIERGFCDPGLLKLTEWVSRYYMASWSETLSLALPGKIIGYHARKPWTPPDVPEPPGTPPTLTFDQHRAAQAILTALSAAAFKPFLLFGVTGSGKTEIYLRAAEATIQQGKSAIILVPEIALTPLLIARFTERFPGRLVALHSGLREAARKTAWQALRDGKVRLVVGARSAVFAPVKDLGLIVVDEEHDHSYKELERSPHYNARDVAVMRAKFENAVTVLASATPSVESFYNAKRKAYELLQLPKRIADRPLPKAAIISMRGGLRSGNREPGSGFQTRTPNPESPIPNRSPFSPTLVNAIRERMGTSEQVILFVGRRGYSGQVVCTDCGYVPKCKYCGVPLVYHQSAGLGIRDSGSGTRTPYAVGRAPALQCHFCKYTVPAFDHCPSCRGDNLDYYGVGTQWVVQQLKRMVPGANVLRLDSDAASEPDAYRRILDAFGKGEAKFLVGTQMVTKGFDFPRVTLCAVVSADSTLTMPDFRAAERTFQVLTQVAGRAGRGDKPGQAIFQTLHPDHYAINLAARQDFEKFYAAEIEFRKKLAYPPFARLALVRLMSPDAKLCESVGELLKDQFAACGGIQVLGPIPAFRKKKRNMHIYLMMLRAPRNVHFYKVIDRKLLNFPRARIDLDIDPLEIL